MRAGDRRALAAVVTELEAWTDGAQATIQALVPFLGQALVIELRTA